MTSSPEDSFQFCTNCEYNLTGLTENRCPECGTEFDRLAPGRSPYPNVKPITKTELLSELMYVPALRATLAIVGGFFGTAFLGGPIPILLFALILFAVLYFKAESLVLRLRANIRENCDEMDYHRPGLFWLKWGVVILFAFQIAVVIGVLFLLRAIFIPTLS